RVDGLLLSQHADLVRELEAPAARREELGERELLLLGIVFAERLAALLGTCNLHGHAEVLLEEALEALIDVVAHHLAARDQLLCAALEGGEVILVSLDEIADLLR